MATTFRIRIISKFSLSASNRPDCCHSLSQLTEGFRSFTSSMIGNAHSAAAESRISDQSSDSDATSGRTPSYDRRLDPRNPPDPIPGRPLRGVQPRPGFQSQRPPAKGKEFGHGNVSLNANKNRSSGLRKLSLFDEVRTDDSEKTGVGKDPKSFDMADDDFLGRFRLGSDKQGKPLSNAGRKEAESDQTESQSHSLELPQPQDADEIFKKMKETGLIPNAVAMLDGLCKDGLVQEAMKLFGLMRERGTIPEVVIYTAVVEGFCKAQKYDDAKRVFKKMQNAGVSPNAFSYNVLVRGLCAGDRLEDALEFCGEMLEAGHSPNIATFVGLVAVFNKGKGVEEARNMVGQLKQKGFLFDKKAAKEHLEKNGPFLPAVREVILGKESSQWPF